MRTDKIPTNPEIQTLDNKSEVNCSFLLHISLIALSEKTCGSKSGHAHRSVKIHTIVISIGNNIIGINRNKYVPPRFTLSPRYLLSSFIKHCIFSSTIFFPFLHLSSFAPSKQSNAQHSTTILR